LTLISDKEITQVWEGADITLRESLRVLYGLKKSLDVCGDAISPSVMLSVHPVKAAYTAIHNRGIRIRFITEITRTNLSFCKEMMQIAEVRHLDGIKGNFSIADSSDYAGISNLTDSRPITQLIVSNVEGFVEQQQYFFETLWGKAIPAKQRIAELEEGRTRTSTKVVEEPGKILSETKRMVFESESYVVCSVPDGLKYAYYYARDVFTEVLERHKAGRHGGIRWLTTIDGKDAEVLELAKKFASLGMEVRHTDVLPPMSFGVSDRETGVTIEKLEGGELNSSAIFSDDPLYLKYYSSMIDELWRTAMPLEKRIQEIESGVEHARVRIISDARESLAIARSTVSGAKNEVLVMFASAAAFIRQMRMGSLRQLSEALTNGASARIIVPDHLGVVESVKIASDACPRADFRIVDSRLESDMTIVLVDGTKCIVFELGDDSLADSLQAVGFAIYMNSRKLASSYRAIFESFWKQTELYERIQRHDAMQREFINVAAHELKTPMQPIVGIAELVAERSPGQEVLEISRTEMEIILRNARRLERLSSAILDTAKIESGTLAIHRSRFELDSIIRPAVEEARQRLSGRQVTVIYLPARMEIEADRDKIAQVVQNLFDNAIKSTATGTIAIAITQSDDRAIFAIKDTGRGIPAEILTRLFTKFATRSERGTGLGLFISKSIIEAHGGTISGQNNADGPGATFTFSIPMKGD
jgi:signal transduction histidine kinase